MPEHLLADMHAYVGPGVHLRTAANIYQVCWAGIPGPDLGTAGTPGERGLGTWSAGVKVDVGQGSGSGGGLSGTGV